MKYIDTKSSMRSTSHGGMIMVARLHPDKPGQVPETSSGQVMAAEKKI